MVISAKKKRNLHQNINDSKSHIWNYFLRVLFRAHNFFIFVHTFQWTSSPFFFNFRFFSRKSQSHQKLAKKIAHFTIQFRSKSLTHFMNLMKIICSRTTAKNLSDFTNVPANIILFGFRKNICTAPFLLAQDCILKALWKQMSVYLRKKIFFPKSSKILSDRGGVGGRLNNLLKAARSLGSVKCFPIFHFNRNF